MSRSGLERLARWVTPRLVARVGIAMTLLLFCGGYYTAWRDYHKQFVLDASERSADVVEALQDRLLELDGLRRFIKGAGQLDRKSFREFVQPVLKQPGIQAMAWAPVIPASRRAFMEPAAGKNGFSLTQLAADGSLVPVTARQRYVPLAFLEPLKGKEAELGYDLGSDQSRDTALRTAEKTGEATVTSRIRLIAEQGSYYGFLLCSPVFDEERKLRGFAVEVFRSGDMLEAAIRPTTRLAINTTLRDMSATGVTGGEVLHRHEVLRAVARQLPGLDDLLFPQLTHCRDFLFAGRQWRITCEGTRGYHADTVSLAFLLILPVGLIITRLSFLYLRQQLRSREEVEALVAVRTAELCSSNGRLLDEIVGHRQTVEALRESRSRFQTFFERIGSTILLINPESGDIIDANTAAEQFYGYPRSTLRSMKYAEINRLASRATDGGTHQTAIQLHRLADGAFRAVEVHSSLIESRDGTGACVLFAIIHDITSRQEMEAERELHQLHLGIAMDLARLAYWEFDQTTVTFTFDDRCYAQYATSAEQEGGGCLPLAEYIQRFVHPEDAPLVASAFTQPPSGNRISPQNLEYRVLRRDGALRYLALFYHAGDNESRHHGATQDITELKQIRRRLEEDQRFLRSLLDTIPDLISYKDPAGRYLGCNEAFAVRFIGRSKEEIIGRDDRTLIPHEEMALVYSQREREALTAATPVTRDEAVIMSNGEQLLLETIRIPFRDEDGRILGIISVGRDVTARRELEQALELSHNHMQTILDNLPMQAWLKDREGRLLMVNHKYAEAVGRTREEILGRTVFDLWPQDLAGDFHASDEEIMASGVCRQVEEQHSLKPGAAWFEAFKSPIVAADGTVIGTTGTARDITQRKQAEELIMMQQYKLEALNVHLEELVEEEIEKNRTKDLLIMRQEKLASIGQLAAGVAHEINTPLGFVSSNISVLGNYFGQMNKFMAAQREFLDSSSTEKQLRELLVVEKRLDIPYILVDVPELIAESISGVERVSRIVLDLKSFSRVDAPSYEMADLSACLESAVVILTHELNDVAVITKEYGKLPPILCNPGELNQLFLNLLRNAAQAVTPPGRITLRSWYDDGFVYAAVADDGHGIPEQLKERIFEPFFTTKDIGHGTGLGLSVCHDIITKHQGALRVESAVGSGAIFTVKLPRRNELSSLHDSTPNGA